MPTIKCAHILCALRRSVLYLRALSALYIYKNWHLLRRSGRRLFYFGGSTCAQLHLLWYVSYYPLERSEKISQMPNAFKSSYFDADFRHRFTNSCLMSCVGSECTSECRCAACHGKIPQKWRRLHVSKPVWRRRTQNGRACNHTICK